MISNKLHTLNLSLRNISTNQFNHFMEDEQSNIKLHVDPGWG